MKIKGQTTTEIEVDDREMKKIVLKYIYENFDWGEDYYIKNGDVMERKVFHTTHSWSNLVLKRGASEKDYFIYGMVELIKKKRP
jgi:hypothetical protein